MYGNPQQSNRDKGRKFREPLSSRTKYMHCVDLVQIPGSSYNPAAVFPPAR
jgi:hypothetical protein